MKSRSRYVAVYIKLYKKFKFAERVLATNTTTDKAPSDGYAANSYADILGNIQTFVNGQSLSPEQAKKLFESINKTTSAILSQTGEMIQKINQGFKNSFGNFGAFFNGLF